MTLSRRGDYVMRAAIALARAQPSGRPCKIREVVGETAIPATFASQILADLARAGLATSRAGRAGGYRLARDPGAISVLEVVEAAEGPLEAARCALGDGPCRWEAVCPLHETWQAATGRLRELLAATTLAEVAARDAEIEAGTYRSAGASHRARPVEIEVDDRVEVELPLAAADLALAGLGAALSRLVGAALGGGRGVGSGAGAEATLERGRRRTATGSPLDFRLHGVVLGPESTRVVEGALTLRRVDASRCELRLAGTWREERRGGRRASSALEREARAGVRRLLRELARRLDTPAT